MIVLFHKNMRCCKMVYELGCCPKCGDCKWGTIGKIYNCEVCGCIRENTGMQLDSNEYATLIMKHKEEYNQLIQSTREQYTLNSPQFDQAAWDRRVGIENGTIKVPEKPEPKPVPKCPTCGSTDVHRISTLNRGASVAMWGLFSGKIGKNYECENCKARW